jgi:hypothetical protein
VTIEDLKLRAQVLRRRARLDAALAEGVRPNGDAALALRARQLTAPATRRLVAGELRDLVQAAQAGRPSAGPQPPLQHAAVLAAEDELAAIAERLSDGDEIDPQAVALAALLVWDLGSPVYSPREDASVAAWADAVLDVDYRGSRSRYPTPGSVIRYRGRDGSGSILARM